ncbi:hypothetical protein BDV93DRAFT_547648 [Ceratobasidium sp. AG-I]|nr:hypothetical protein BDV93DRAFT_547648 [Ceratobasidium sp. AG-I]
MAAVYTPPRLPGYLANAFDLKPVIGTPTDEEFMVLIDTNGKQVPTLFNPILSTELANHLFEVQMARYVRRAAQAQHTPQVRPTPELASVPAAQEENHQAVNSARASTAASPIPEPSMIDISGRDVQEPTLRRDPDPSGQFPVPDLLNPCSDRVLASQGMLGDGEGRAPQNGVKELLTSINQSLQNLHRTMIVTHNSMARQVGKSDGCRYPIIINSKGEDQAAYGIQYPGPLQSGVGDANLARLLRYFDIGDELLEEGSEPSLKSGTSTKAYAALLIEKVKISHHFA